MKYSVRAVKRRGYAGRHRDGHFFSSETPTVLDEISDAIRNDRHLIIEEVAKEPDAPAVEAEPTDPETPAPRRKRQRK